MAAVSNAQLGPNSIGNKAATLELERKAALVPRPGVPFASPQQIYWADGLLQARVLTSIHGGCYMKT